MIHVPRAQTDETGAAIRPDASWFESASKATAQACAERGKHAADRTVYGHAKLRAALARLFRDKCAYCESSLLNSDWEVDHFRPKGRVAECPEHPGYYWLAYEWTNLYPACEHCNQHRRERRRWGHSAPACAGGKADQFPLRDETHRALTHEATLEDEESLLLDPCRDDPKEHLRFRENGEIFALDESDRGSKTIEVLFLDRADLNVARRTRVRVVCWLLEQAGYLRAIGQVERAGRIEGLCVDADAPYAAAARAVLRDPAAFGL